MWVPRFWTEHRNVCILMSGWHQTKDFILLSISFHTQTTPSKFENYSLKIYEFFCFSSCFVPSVTYNVLHKINHLLFSAFHLVLYQALRTMSCTRLIIYFLTLLHKKYWAKCLCDFCMEVFVDDQWHCSMVNDYCVFKITKLVYLHQFCSS